MAASASFCLDDGIFTRSCIAVLALRTRVSMSAIGSVIIVQSPPSSPARLRHTRDLARVNQFAKADAAQHELAVHRLRSSATLAPRVRAHLELRLALLLLDECLLCHYCCPSLRNGKPKASSSALPSASVRAVVTIVMCMPRVTSTRS